MRISSEGAMAAEVRAITEKSYNRQTVEVLRELLKRAEAGEIREIVCHFAVSTKEYELSYTGCDDLIVLVGHLEKMKWRMLERMNRR